MRFIYVVISIDHIGGHRIKGAYTEYEKARDRVESLQNDKFAHAYVYYVQVQLD